MVVPRGMAAARWILVPGLVLTILLFIAPRGAPAQCGSICDQYTLEIPDAKGNDKGGSGGGSGGPDTSAPAPSPAPAPATGAATPAEPASSGAKDKKTKKPDRGKKRSKGAKAKRVRALEPVETPANPTLVYEESSTSSAAFGSLSEPGTLALLGGLALIGMAAAATRRGQAE